MKDLSKKGKAKQERQRWVLTVVLLSFVLTVAMSLVTSVFVESAGLFTALMALLVLVMLGIVTDAVGTAVTSASEQPFIAMASKRIPGARQALYLVRRAERVSSLLCDVVGDIVGIVAGAAGSVIALYLAQMFGLRAMIASLLTAAFTSAFMIGGKAYGKGLSIRYSERIVLFVGRSLAIFGVKGQGKRSVDAKKKRRAGKAHAKEAQHGLRRNTHA